MKTISILQNSKEWDDLRKTKLGASDANIIMGVSEFMTPLELYKKKINPETEEQETNFIQAKGHKKEVKARARFELITGVEWAPIVCLHSEFEWLMASLDGYNAELNENWECKFVGKDDFEAVKSGKTLEKYFPQIQMQMAITGAVICNLTVINENDDILTIKIPVNLEYIQNKLYPALFDFHECIVNKTAPQVTKDDVIDLSNDSMLNELLNDYKIATQKKKEAEEFEERLKDKILGICKHPKCVCNEIKITRSSGEAKESIDYESIISDLKLVIDPKYVSMKNGKVSTKITFPKSEAEKVKKKK